MYGDHGAYNFWGGAYYNFLSQMRRFFKDGLIRVPGKYHVKLGSLLCDVQIKARKVSDLDESFKNLSISFKNDP